jgi:phenylalanyl-tRNA synthetase alpha chain
LEVLGCGILRDGIIDKAGINSKTNKAWAFGIGLERLAMKLYDIKDIRLFWTKDPRFISQFKDGEVVKFKPYSKYPTCYKDLTFFINDDYNENDLNEVIRNISGDLVESVECVDTFTSPKNNKTSKCYRILYRHLDRTVTNEEINDFQNKIRDAVKDILKLELR